LRRTRLFLAGGACLIALQAGAAVAQSVSLSLPEQPLSESLRVVAQKTGHNILFTPDAVSGLRAQAIEGQFSADAAVTLLLTGTGLEAVSDGANGLIVRAQRQSRPAPASLEEPSAPPPETVVATGSRVIFNTANSPTPIAAFPVRQLHATTPSDLPDALNKLPIFQGSTTPRGTNNASANSAGNVLNLRNFGAQRTLVLLDGHRLAPANANGTVDIDALPQMLIQRVEVVTGGASAVYGSGAVTGVVNFVLDKHFTGLRAEVNSGLSTYGDAASYNAGIATGTDLWSGKGHIEVALRRFYQNGVLHNDRPEGPRYWLLTGAGTPANPYVSTPNARLTRFGGAITCTDCAANGQRFSGTGTIGPYDMGLPTGTNGVTQGGDGGYSSIAQVTSSLGTSEAFGRFSYNLGDFATFFLQAMGAESYTKGSFQNHAFQTGAVPNTFLKTNPYMPAALAPLFAGSTPDFSVAGYFDMGTPRSGYQSNGLQRNLHLSTGLDGTLAGDHFTWSLHYLHGEARLHEDDPTNINYQKMYAAMDGIAGGTPGSATCWVSTTVNAGLYPGCVPLNPFGANAVGMNAITPAMNNYISGDTAWWMTNTMDNVSASIAGDLLQLPAGPLKAAFSAEARWLGYEVRSNASPTATVNCTGLRASVPGAPENILCNPATPLWQNNVVAALPQVRDSVWELAGETNLPLVRDQPLLNSLSIDIAGRHTDYGVSGPVQTWKIGVNWHLSSAVALRATNSVDIRAPTLNDLFAPLGQGIQSFSDILHTGITAQNYASSRSNPAMTPEVARTYTAGLAFTPEIAPNLMLSADYYTMTLKNAISAVNGGSSAVLKICEDSNGASPLCNLIVRPLPFSDRSAANFPTQIITESRNTAYNRLEGVDFQVSYATPLQLPSGRPGMLSLRALANLQPVNQSIQYAGAPLVFVAYPKARFSFFATYATDTWSFNLLDRWISGFNKASQAGQVYAEPNVPAINYIDFSIDRKFNLDDTPMDGYLSIQNIFDQRPRVNPTNSTNPGLYFMGVQGSTTSLYDAIGRYFTIGARIDL
jgi:outer membrane receptor protein involved in Fe transport